MARTLVCARAASMISSLAAASARKDSARSLAVASSTCETRVAATYSRVRRAATSMLDRSYLARKGKAESAADRILEIPAAMGMTTTEKKALPKREMKKTAWKLTLTKP